MTNEGIKAGDVIVGLASFGRAAYEQEYNSGIGSNGLTSARHDALSKYYADHFPESFDPALQREVVYIGLHRLSDIVGIPQGAETLQVHVGKLLLSPTRTYLPLMREALTKHYGAIHGLIHNSGGGLTKVMKYIGDGLRVVKDNLFEYTPGVHDPSKSLRARTTAEMSQVFNMGQRLEIYTDAAHAKSFIDLAAELRHRSRIIGRVEAAKGSELVIRKGGKRDPVLKPDRSLSAPVVCSVFSTCLPNV